MILLKKFLKILYFFFYSKLNNFFYSRLNNIYILIRKYSYSLNFLKLYYDINYSEKLISTSSYLNIHHLFFSLKIDEKKIKKKIKKEKVIFKKCYLFDALGRNLFYQGKYKEAVKVFEEEEKLRINTCYKKNLDFNKYFFFPRNTIHVLGLIGHLDAIIKYLILKNKKNKIIIIGDKKTIINKFFFSLFKNYIKLIDINKVDKKDLLDEELYFKNYHWVMPDLKGNYQICHKVFAQTLSKWNKIKGKKKLIDLDKKELFNFKKILEYFKIENKDKIITFHLRSPNNHNTSADNFRYTPLKNYYKSFNYLTNIGFNIFIMGDNIRLNHLKLIHPHKIINYSSSKVRNDKNDVLIINFSKYFIGCNSGPHWIASSLGKEFCLIDVPFNQGFPYYEKKIYLPLVYYKNDKIISLKEILKNYTNCNFSHHFKKKKIIIKNNNPNVVLNTIKEFLYKNKEIKNFKIKDKNKLNNLKNIIKKDIKKLNLDIYGEVSEAYLSSYYIETK